MSNQNIADTFQQAEGLLGATVDDALLMMSVEHGNYYSLNPVAARIWALLEEPVSIATLVEKLTGEYDVSADTCREEVTRFIAALSERGLLR